MKSIITVQSVTIKDNRLEIFYSVTGEISRYFNEEAACFWVEYSRSIESVPYSIAVIPFICNVLPMIWVTDSELIVEELDKEFYESLFEIKHGFMLMMPMINFRGGVKVNSLIDNYYNPCEESAVLFSGGVDAFATLFSKLQERPHLITLWGSDVGLYDLEGWEAVKQHVEDTAKMFALPSAITVKTNFRGFIKEGKLNKLVRATHDGWWHAIQHGIGIIGHTALIAYIYRLKKIYIASSNTVEDKIICASDPVIDSHVRFGSTLIQHDRFSMSRIEKVRLIVQKNETLKLNIKLHVCWISQGGHNCCLCEKCIRTIMNIVSVGGDPEKYGFYMPNRQNDKMKTIVQKALLDVKCLRPAWHDIQDVFIAHNINDERYNWIYNLDIDKNPSLVYRIIVFCKRVTRKIKCLCKL